jgi:hypothetical protein
MRRFERDEEAVVGGDRLEAVTRALYAALVPPMGECVSLQGELVRANDRLITEHLQNGGLNYYDSTRTFATGYYSALLVLVLETLTANRGGALVGDDVAYFAEFLQSAGRDFVRTSRLGELENSETALSNAEQRELEELLAEESAVGQPDWEELYVRARRCIANWCIANPELIDRHGKPVVERGVRDLSSVFAAVTDA